MIRSNYSILPWYDELSQQYHNKWYTNGRGYNLPSAINQLPPFQLVREKTGAQIDYFKIVDCTSGGKTTVTSEIISAGLTVYEGAEYDVIIYPATVFIPVALFSEGTYYAEMSDGTNIWYSELFVMTSRVSEMIKVQFCHAQDMERPSGFIRYEDGFKNYLYINSEIAKPTYPYEEQVQKRGGYTFPIEQISWKQHQFELIAPEYLLDIVRLIRVHDFVTIYKDGETYEVDEMIVPDPEWIPNGNVGRVNIEFKTDTVVTVSGRGVSEATCPINEGLCLAVQYNAVAKLVFGSDEYTGFYYQNGAVQTPLVAGDYVLVEQSGFIRLYTFTRIQTYVLVNALANEVAFDQRDKMYYARPLFSTEFLPASINGLNLDSGDTWNLLWRGIPGSVCEFYVQSADGNERLIGVRASSTLDLAIQFERQENDISALMKVTSPNCGVFYQTEYFPFQGVGAWIIETDFDVTA